VDDDMSSARAPVTSGLGGGVVDEYEWCNDSSDRLIALASPRESVRVNRAALPHQCRITRALPGERAFVG
jgi:hypothetical protein